VNRAIGVLGCGQIAAQHLDAYRSGGLPVVALCDPNEEAVTSKGREYFPKAATYVDVEEFLKHPDMAVVDIATHVDVRPDLVEKVLRSGRHVLSQKPFVESLARGRELCSLARKLGLRLAVNQNARFAPHFHLARGLVKQGVLGTVQLVEMSVHWDHSWVRGKLFEAMPHLVLFDFGIHWFDMARCLFGPSPATNVTAWARSLSGQPIAPPMLAHAVIEFSGGLASLGFHAWTRHGPQDRTTIIGDRATLVLEGVDYQSQRATLFGEHGEMPIAVTGRWFPDAFLACMCHFLDAIDSGAASDLEAEENLDSLQLCFAAVASSLRGTAVQPQAIDGLPAE
jgi:predicted dehydrogenase